MTELNSDPKQTIVTYYKLATSNQKEAIKLLSDAWRQEEAKKTIKTKDNWWNSVGKVEIYSFQTFAKNNSKAKIKVWLNYYIKNGQIFCESLIFDLIFDSNKNTWLLDGIKPNSVIDNPYCNTK